MKLTSPLAGLLGLSASATAANIKLAGINFSGLSEGENMLGTPYTSFQSVSCGEEQTAYPYPNSPDLYYAWRELGFNLIRLPVAWGYIQEGLQGPLNQTTLGQLDHLVDVITGDGSTAIVDLHNYARYYCAVIGQPANKLPNAPFEVTDEDFVDLWRKLARHYKDNPNVIFELMNEPWGLSAFRWAETMKKAIKAILSEAPNHRILIAGPLASKIYSFEIRSALALLPLLDEAPKGQIIFDFHQYFDILNGGTPDCLDWGLFYLPFKTVTDTMRKHNAHAMLTEFGGGPSDACVAIFEKLLPFMEENSDVWIGWTAWSNNVDEQAILPNKSSEQFALAEVMVKYAPLKVSSQD